MTDFNVCIACLSSGIKICSIKNIQVREVYEKFTNTKLCVGIPETICYLCYSQLQKCHEFMNMSQKAGKILTQLFHSGIQISQETVSPLTERKMNQFVTTVLKPISVTSSNDNRFLEDSLIYDDKRDTIKSSKLEIINAANEADTMPEAQVTITLKEEPIETDEQIAEAIEEEFVCVKEEPIERDVEFDIKQEYDIKLVPLKEEIKIVKKEEEIIKSELKAAIQCHIENSKKDAPSDYPPERNENNLLKVRSKYTEQSNKKEKSHACTRCDQKFSGPGLLIRHMRMHTGEKPFACQSCDKKFSQSGHLAQHIRSHTGEKPYICNTCNKAFNRKNNFITHVKKHSELSFHLCNICNKVLSNKGGLKRHMLIHTGEKPYICQSCGKTFSQKGHLIQHLRLHTGEKPHACNSCSISFYRKGQLDNHIMLTHTQDYPHLCTICNRRFPTQSKFKRHMNIHTDENTCDEAFDHEQNYKTYLENHVEVISHKCDVCNKILSSKGDLEKHMIKHISIHEKPYACNFCEKEFVQECDLTNHLVMHTGEKPFSCHECSKTFSSKAILANHKRIHSGERSFVSDKCEKTYKKEGRLNHSHHNNLQQHSLLISSKEKLCVKNECSEILVQNTESQHTLPLSVQKPFVCNLCNKAYNRKNNLQRHKKIHIRRNEEFIIP